MGKCGLAINSTKLSTDVSPFPMPEFSSVLISHRYSEAIEMLYTENTFNFESLNDVLKLSLTLVPERMALIQSVRWKPSAFSPHYLINTPWLHCQNRAHCTSQLSCCCVKCWPEAIGLDGAQVNESQYGYFKDPILSVPYLDE